VNGAGRSWAAVALFALLVSAPFWDKPFHVDEPFFLAIARQVAAAAVTATEQEFRKAPAPLSDDEAQALRQTKRNSALGRFFQLLPPGVAIGTSEAQGLIEGALHDVNIAKEWPGVDTE